MSISRTFSGIVFASLVVMACAGLKARAGALIPAMRLAWPGIASDVAVGATALPEPEASSVLAGSAEMSEALRAGARERVLAVDWPSLRRTATGGIAIRLSRGEVGTGVALSLRNRVVEFDAAFRKLGER